MKILSAGLGNPVSNHSRCLVPMAPDVQGTWDHANPASRCQIGVTECIVGIIPWHIFLCLLNCLEHHIVQQTSCRLRTNISGQTLVLILQLKWFLTVKVLQTHKCLSPYLLISMSLSVGWDCRVIWFDKQFRTGPGAGVRADWWYTGGITNYIVKYTLKAEISYILG